MELVGESSRATVGLLFGVAQLTNLMEWCMERSCARRRISVSKIAFVKAVIQDFENSVYRCVCGLVR
jgi:hypothetical protein